MSQRVSACLSQTPRELFLWTCNGVHGCFFRFLYSIFAHGLFLCDGRQTAGCRIPIDLGHAEIKTYGCQGRDKLCVLTTGQFLMNLQRTSKSSPSSSLRHPIRKAGWMGKSLSSCNEIWFVDSWIRETSSMVPSTFLKNVKSTAKVTGAYLSTIPPPSTRGDRPGLERRKLTYDSMKLTRALVAELVSMQPIGENQP